MLYKNMAEMILDAQPQSQEKIMEHDHEHHKPESVTKIPSRFKSVCVFCGSSPGKKESYAKAAIELGQQLLARKLGLVYGGGSIGLMGLVAHTVHHGGGNVLGIIPKSLMGKEITGETFGQVKTVYSMHERKAEMASHSDAFVALPGGYGTLEELLEVVTWAQLGIHDKPVGLLNVDGYYNSLLKFIDEAVDEEFIKPSQRDILISATSAKELIQKLEDYKPVKAGSLTKKMWEVEQPSVFNAASPLEVAVASSLKTDKTTTSSSSSC